MNTPLRRLAYATAIVVVGAFAVLHLKGPNGLPDLIEKRRAIRVLEEQNKSLKADNERRRLRNHDLKSKPDAWDLEIRKRMEKLKKGETNFRLPPEGPAAPRVEGEADQPK
jgi:cell division protein FtsB